MNRLSYETFFYPRCGSKDFSNEKDNTYCLYCKSKFNLDIKTKLSQAASIDLSNDIQALLAKCRENPANRRRYANLILDIDPTNPDATRYPI